MVAIIGILCLLLVWQILKIILKKGIINKNITDYALEYIVSITILIALFMQESISRNSLFIIAVFGIIYEIISLIYMYFRYYKKETITDFSIKKVIDECEFGILVLKGKRAKLINNKMYEILDKLNIKKDYITNIIKQSIDKIDKNYCVKLENKYYVFVVNDNEIITFDITEEYKLHQKLNGQNKKLKENNKKILFNKNDCKYLKQVYIFTIVINICNYITIYSKPYSLFFQVQLTSKIYLSLQIFYNIFLLTLYTLFYFVFHL